MNCRCLMGLRTKVGRDDVVHVYKRNGAYLIVVMAEGTENWAESDHYDCAGSLVEAKRVARMMVAEVTVAGRFRWERETSDAWALWANVVREEWDGEDDE